MSDLPRIAGQEQVKLAMAIIEGFSLLMAVFILAASFWIRSIPSARHHVQRVSYRIILWALAAQSFYDIDRLCLYGSSASREFFYRHDRLCTAGVYFFIKQLHFTNFLITCIAINLMLIVCFGINPIEKKLIHYYVSGSFILAAAIPLVPAALGHFGPDPLYKLCYLVPYEVVERMRVVVLDVVLWGLCSCIVASGSILAVLITLFRQGRRTALALRLGNPMNIDITKESPPSSPGSGNLRPSFFSWQSWRSKKYTPDDVEDSSAQSVETYQLQDRFLRIALKISLYPIFLIVANVITIVADLYFNNNLRNGVNSGQLVFLAVYQFLYAGRGFCFAILCVTIDPSFRGGLKAAWHAKRTNTTAILDGVEKGNNQGHPTVGDNMSFAQFLSSQPSGSNNHTNRPDIGTRQRSDESVDLESALTALPFTAPHAIPALAEFLFDDEERKAGNTTIRSVSGRHTRLFAGVKSDSLPSGLSDDVDVDFKLSYIDSPTRYTRPVPIPELAIEMDESALMDKAQGLDEDADEKKESLILARATSEQGVRESVILPVIPALLGTHRPRVSLDIRGARSKETRLTEEEIRKRLEELKAQL